MKLVFLGPPGAGKGTLSALAKEAFQLPHISTGDLFRAAIKNQTELGKKVKSIVDSGGLVPDQVTIEIVKEKLSELTKGFILDGFPRTVQQAEALQGFSDLEAVVNFELSRESLIQRLTGRVVCRSCGSVYHLTNLPPKVAGVCDSCGGELYTRKDDEASAIAQRLDVYDQQTQPLIDYYQSKGLLKDIDSSGSPESILETLKKVLEK